METFIHQAVSGLASGCVYAAIGLALVVIYQSTNTINFAQGEMAMFSTYVAWVLIQAGVPYWIAFAVTLLGSFAAGMLIERVLIRPLANAPVLSVVLVFIGLLVILNSMAGWLFGDEIKVFKSPFPSATPFGTTLFSGHEFGTFLVTLVSVAALFVFLRFTRVGLAMRAAAQNPFSSRLSGIPVGLMLSMGWGIAAAIGAVTGMMVAPIVYLEPNMMSGILLYGFAAALLGGIDNPWGAVVGGLLVGVLENLAGACLVGTELKLSVALAIILAVLLLRPSGLFGRRVVVRV